MLIDVRIYLKVKFLFFEVIIESSKLFVKYLMLSLFTIFTIFNAIAISDAETKAETYAATAVDSIVTAGSASGLPRFLHRILLVVHLFQ